MHQVAVPSYKRAATLATKTLPLLQGLGVDPRTVTVFVGGDLADLREYEATLARVLPGYPVALASAPPGLVNARRAINEHYPEGTPLLSFDDDVAALAVKESDKRLRPADGSDLRQLLADADELRRRFGLRLWGIYPVWNAMFMKHSTTTDLRYVVGCVYGHVATLDPELQTALSDKEDYERTLRYFVRDGGVVRFNHVAPKTKYWSEPGGMQAEFATPDERNAASEVSITWLLERYPGLCQRDTRAKGGHPDLRLRDTRGRA